VPRSELRQLLLAWMFTGVCRALREAAGAANSTDVVSAWHLDRVLRRVFAEAGASSERAHRLAALVRFAELTSGQRGLVERLFWLTGGEVPARDFLGVNLWNGQLWFREEALAELVTWLAQVDALERPAVERPDLANQADDASEPNAEEVLAAASASQFQLPLFREWLENGAQRRKESSSLSLAPAPHRPTMPRP
jgi:hypothetical protein